jgi:hypothetical protein
MRFNLPPYFFRNILVFIFLTNHPAFKAVLCTATVSGAWSNNSTWSCAGGPNCGDTIVIPVGRTVTITNQQDFMGCAVPLKITIYGRLHFNPGFKLKLPCGSRIYIFQNGYISGDGGGGSANYVEICTLAVWSSTTGPYTGPNCLPPSPCPFDILPIELANFTASVTGKEVNLNWTTQSEKNNKKFVVERSFNALDFIEIADIPSKSGGSNSNKSIQYVAVDHSPVSGINYYRLKQVDTDGDEHYSSVVKAIYAVTEELSAVIYPNPGNGEFSIDLSGAGANQSIQVRIKDQFGKEVYYSNSILEGPAARVSAQFLSPGIYFCTITTAEGVIKLKMLVD